MNSQLLRALVALAFACFAPLALAQEITVTPGTVVKAGGTVDVAFFDASRAGQTVTISISNGEAHPYEETVTVDVKLDSQGKGHTSWIAPWWDQAIFSGGGAADIAIFIDQ
jgi:hypothetical protein